MSDLDTYVVIDKNMPDATLCSATILGGPTNGITRTALSLNNQCAIKFTDEDLRDFEDEIEGDYEINISGDIDVGTFTAFRVKSAQTISELISAEFSVPDYNRVAARVTLADNGPAALRYKRDDQGDWIDLKVEDRDIFGNSESPHNLKSDVPSGTHRFSAYDPVDGSWVSDEAVLTIESPIVIPPVGTGGGTITGQSNAEVWAFNQFQNPPLGLNCEILYASDRGYVNTSNADTYPNRFELNVTEDGLPCFRHNVIKDAVVRNLSSGGSPHIFAEYFKYDYVGMRVHMKAFGFSGIRGKMWALLLGYGFGGDMIQNQSGHFNPQVPYSACYGSTEPSVVNWMKPEADKVNEENYHRMYVMYADPSTGPISGKDYLDPKSGTTNNRRIGNRDYVPNAFRNQPSTNVDMSEWNAFAYGKTVSDDQSVYPLEEWFAVDVLAARDGPILIRAGQILGERRGSQYRLLKDWDAQRCITPWCRLQNGGRSENSEYHAARTFHELFGGVFVYGAN